MSQREIISRVVHAFYDKAKTDILIGYHFRNISDFEVHVPRIAQFWEIQLLGSASQPVDPPFDVMKVHLPLGIKRGELGRWLLLFKNTLEEFDSELGPLKSLWLHRLSFFEGVFIKFFGF